MMLLESVISSEVELSAIGAAGEQFTKWLQSDSAVLRRLDDWTFSEILDTSISCCLEGNEEIVGVHYSSLERIVTELTESVANSLEGTAFAFQSLQPFGSSVSQLCVAGSCDIDVVLCVANQVKGDTTGDDNAVEVTTDNREESCDVLALVKEGLLQGDTFEVKELVTMARVPVLKLRHVESGTEVRSNRITLLFVEFSNLLVANMRLLPFLRRSILW